MSEKRNPNSHQPAADDALALLARLCDRQGPRAFAYAESLLHDTDLAEQVVQEAMLSAWRAGVAGESSEAAANLLLLAVVRRGVREMLVARRLRRTSVQTDLEEILGEQRLRDVRLHVEAFPDGVLIVDRDGRLLVANAVARAGTSTPLPPTLGVHASVLDYQRPDGTPFRWEEQPLGKALLERRTVLCQPVRVPSSGDSDPELLLVSATPVHDPREAPVGALAIARRSTTDGGYAPGQGFATPAVRDVAARLAALRGRIERNIEEVLATRPTMTSFLTTDE